MERPEDALTNTCSLSLTMWCSVPPWDSAIMTVITRCGSLTLDWNGKLERHSCRVPSNRGRTHMYRFCLAWQHCPPVYVLCGALQETASQDTHYDVLDGTAFEAGNGHRLLFQGFSLSSSWITIIFIVVVISSESSLLLVLGQAELQPWRLC